MEVRILGSHSLESRDTRHTCFLIDRVLGLDAGSISSALTVREQTQVKSVLLTHQHYDHIQDIPTLGLSTLDESGSIDIYSLPETLAAVRTHLLNGSVYPDLTEPLSPSEEPKYKFQAFKPDKEFSALNYLVKPISVPHTVPAVGYILQSKEGGCMAYTGDAGGGLLPFFRDPLSPQVVFVDATFPDRLKDLASLTGHLTPGLLREQLMQAQEEGLALPRLVAVHFHPDYRTEVTDELGLVAQELGVDLTFGDDGMVISV